MALAAAGLAADATRAAPEAAGPRVGECVWGVSHIRRPARSPIRAETWSGETRFPRLVRKPGAARGWPRREGERKREGERMYPRWFRVHKR